MTSPHARSLGSSFKLGSALPCGLDPVSLSDGVPRFLDLKKSAVLTRAASTSPCQVVNN
jgi:hypothetical protein